MGNALTSLPPGLGRFVLVDEHGPRIRPWQESSTRGKGQRPLITPGMTEDDIKERLESPTFVPSHNLTPTLNRLVENAPKIRKTSGLSKATRLTQTWQEHFKMWRAYLGRPMVVGDLSPEMRRAFHMEGLPATQAITRRLIERAAKRYLAEAEREMREQQNKKVTKEAFYVPAGVR